MNERNGRMIEIKTKRLTQTTTLPTRGSDQAAGSDLHADIGDSEYVVVHPHSTNVIGTGLAVEIPDGYFGAIFARSGLATKEGLRPANCVGVVDSDYRGEIKVAIHNDMATERYITHGERIAQLVIMPYLPVGYTEVDELSDTDRGSGGFGSTGK